MPPIGQAATSSSPAVTSGGGLKRPGEAEGNRRQQQQRTDQPHQRDSRADDARGEVAHCQAESDPCEQDEREHRHTDGDEGLQCGYGRRVSWTPAWRGTPGRPPMAGTGVLKVPVM